MTSTKTKEDVLRDGIRQCGEQSHRRKKRWQHVAEAFLLERDDARDACEWAGVHPDEQIGVCSYYEVTP